MCDIFWSKMLMTASNLITHISNLLSWLKTNNANNIISENKIEPEFYAGVDVKLRDY